MGLVLGQSWIVVLINRHILFCPPIIIYCEVCCCLHIHSVVNVLVLGVSTWAKFDVHIYLPRVSSCMQKYVAFIMYYGSAWLLFIHKLHCLQTCECTFDHQSLGVYEVSCTYLLGCLRYVKKHVKDVCCCLQTCNSVVNMLVMGLVPSNFAQVLKLAGGVCCCLQICNTVVYVLVIGLVLGQSLMVLTPSLACLQLSYIFVNNNIHSQLIKISCSTNPITTTYKTELHVCKQQHTSFTCLS